MKSRQIDLGINRGGIQAAMAQQVSNLFKWSSAFNDTSRHGMSQNVGPTNAAFESTSLGRVAHGVAHDIQAGRRIDGVGDA